MPFTWFTRKTPQRKPSIVRDYANGVAGDVIGQNREPAYTPGWEATMFGGPRPYTSQQQAMGTPLQAAAGQRQLGADIFAPPDPFAFVKRKRRMF